MFSDQIRAKDWKCAVISNVIKDLTLNLMSPSSILLPAAKSRSGFAEEAVKAQSHDEHNAYKRNNYHHYDQNN